MSGRALCWAAMHAYLCMVSCCTYTIRTSAVPGRCASSCPSVHQDNTLAFFVQGVLQNLTSTVGSAASSVSSSAKNAVNRLTGDGNNGGLGSMTGPPVCLFQCTVWCTLKLMVPYHQCWAQGMGHLLGAVKHLGCRCGANTAGPADNAELHTS